MKISILTGEGSPVGVTSKSIWGDRYRVGVGGAEIALLTMCEEWTKAGHEVILYNSPHEANASPFEQRAMNAFNAQEKQDVMLVFRSPNPKAIVANGLKVFWSCDQYTSGDYRNFAGFMDKIVCISPYHIDYFNTHYRIANAISIDLPVRVGDYEGMEVEKVPGRILFSSIPDRGLEILRRMWPKIRQEIPDVSLAITSDYRLWGSSSSNGHHRVKWAAQEGVIYLGAVPRARLIEEQLKSDITLYPSIYEELFCITIAESEVAGSYSITSGEGALPTTNMGIVLPVDTKDMRNDKLFIDETAKLLSDKKILKKKQRELQKKAIKRFHPDNILAQWDEKVFK